MGVVLVLLHGMLLLLRRVRVVHEIALPEGTLLRVNVFRSLGVYWLGKRGWGRGVSSIVLRGETLLLLEPEVQVKTVIVWIHLRGRLVGSSKHGCWG